MKLIKAVALSITVAIGLSFTWPTKLDQKVKKTITKTFELETYKLKAIRINEKIEKETVRKINDCLFSIHSDDNKLGYIYVGQAPSMKNVFDFAIVFNPNLKIINAKVLIYREKHGRQIGMKRWLKQFFGMNTIDRPEIGLNVDGISGATISTTSMTDAVREVLISTSSIQNHDVL